MKTEMKQLFTIIGGVWFLVIMMGAILPLLLSTDKLPMPIIVSMFCLLLAGVGTVLIIAFDKFKKRMKSDD